MSRIHRYLIKLFSDVWQHWNIEKKRISAFLHQLLLLLQFSEQILSFVFFLTFTMVNAYGTSFPGLIVTGNATLTRQEYFEE